jgi:hypothetical protein
MCIALICNLAAWIVPHEFGDADSFELRRRMNIEREK